MSIIASAVAIICFWLQFSSLANAMVTIPCDYSLSPQEYELRSYSSQLAALYKADITPDTAPIHNLFATLGQVSVRSKSESSIFSKLQHNKVQPANLQQALTKIPDGIGIRLILNDASPKAIVAFVDTLTKAILNHQIQITDLENYHGPNTLAYLSEAQVIHLSYVANMTGHPMHVRTGPHSLKSSGYTTLQMNIKFPHGVSGELQVRGPVIHSIAEAEHLAYDLRQGKLDAESKAAVKHAKDVLTGLTPTQQTAYSNYILACYIWGRSAELGQDIKTPSRPRFIEAHSPLDICTN